MRRKFSPLKEALSAGRILVSLSTSLAFQINMSFTQQSCNSGSFRPDLPCLLYSTQYSRCRLSLILWTLPGGGTTVLTHIAPPTNLFEQHQILPGVWNPVFLRLLMQPLKPSRYKGVSKRYNQLLIS